ncbi:MAG: hypothetical protein RR138_07110, partial [Akkermansia sp.]
MYKTILSLIFIMSSSCAFATTHLTPDLQKGLKYWWDFQAPVPTDTDPSDKDYPYKVLPIDYTGTVGSAFWSQTFKWTPDKNYGQI